VTRRDIALALSTGWPYPVVAELDDRIKVTAWHLLEDSQDQR
jgi:hypothetical protein